MNPKKTEAQESYQDLPEWVGEELTVEDFSLVLKKSGPKMGPDITLYPHFKSFYFVMLTLHPIPCLPPIAQSIKIFSAYFISCLFTPHLEISSTSLTSGSPTASWKFTVWYPPLFTSGCIIITSPSSITLPHRAALLFPSSCRHLCFQALLRTYLQVN